LSRVQRDRRPGPATIATRTVLVALLLAGCGSGGGGGDGGGVDDSKNSKSLALVFEPDEPNPGPGTAALGLETASGDTVGLRIGVRGVDDVRSASLDVTYDPSRVDFVDWSAGDLLESSGSKPFYLVSEQSGRIVIGVSLAGSGPGVDVGASLTLVRLTFRALDDGASHVDFDNMALLDSASTPQEIPGLSWYGGDLLAN
jgi:hypothetical protein